MFVVGGLGFELWVFVAGWRHALRSEWPFIIIIIINTWPIIIGVINLSSGLLLLSQDQAIGNYFIFIIPINSNTVCFFKACCSLRSIPPNTKYNAGKMNNGRLR